MNYTIMELIWLLLIYSFLGWVIETIVGTVKKKKFVNRGFSTGPFCLVYGTAAVFMAVTMEELRADPVFQLLGCGILATIIEWMAGKILERLNQHKWWDYSDKNGILTDISVCSILYCGQFWDFWQCGMPMDF